MALGSRTKIIVFHRAEKPFTGLRKWAQKFADKFINAYLFTSKEFENQWNKNINTKKIHEIVQASSVFYPTDKTTAREALGIGEGRVFLWVGSLIPRKDPVTIVKTFLKYAQEAPGAKLYMIYQSGELLEEIKDLTKNQESIILVGKVAHSKLSNWYNCADFFITGSSYEGSGVALIEAMSCGCIPIATNFISFRKMTGEGTCGLLFETGNEEALFSTLLQTAKLDIEKERISVLRQFHKELSFEAIASKINAIISV
jgi:glycosyltransferase involved in cell wall biosynthesis